MADHIRYDLLTQQALRSVVRSVLADTAKKGLPGEHHFYISFETQADGVKLSERLRAQYPEEMTIILQHQFWDLTVSETGFEVGMSFGGIPEKLHIPFAAITGFFDPSVQFGLQFEEMTEEPAAKGEAAKGETKPAATPLKSPVTPVLKSEPMKSEAAKSEKPAAKPSLPSIAPAPSVPAVTPVADAPSEPSPDKPSGGGEVVRLDRFRKK